MTRKPTHQKSAEHEVDVEILSKGKAAVEDFDASQELVVQPKKPENKLISIRLPMDTIVRLRAIAGKRGMGYQQLIKQYLAEALTREQHRTWVWTSAAFQQGYPIGERCFLGSTTTQMPTVESCVADVSNYKETVYGR